MNTIIIKLTVILLIQFLSQASTERLGKKMYTSILGATCFRRLNGTHQTGCTSKPSGSVGALHLIKTQDDFEFLLNSPTAPPYAPIIPPDLFTRSNILKLKNASQNISAIILINKIDKLKQFSNELQCPNKYSGINGTEGSCDSSRPETLWNPQGTGLMHEDFPFPIHYIADQEEINTLTSCFEKFNNFDFENQKYRSLCSIEIQSFMSAAVNSEVCMRRSSFVNNLSPVRYCDPLEGKNIYGTLYPRAIVAAGERKNDKNEKFILVSCRLDTTSMFEEVGLGAQDSLVSYATLLNVAHLLGNILPNRTSESANLNILFVIFNGESYDYIGSQSFVFDLEGEIIPYSYTHRNPIGIGNIEFMIDLGVLDDFNNIDMYTLNSFSQAKMFFEKMQSFSQEYNVNLKFKETTNLPPTSAQSFLRANVTFPALILSSKPNNSFYHSIYDDAVNLNYIYGNRSEDYTKLMTKDEAIGIFPENSVQMKVRNTATIIALSLYEILSGTKYTGKLIANPLLVDEFLHCFLESQDCPLFKAVSQPNSFDKVLIPNIPPNRYISVANAFKDASIWSYRVLGYVLSQKQENITSKDSCKYLPLFWYAGFNGSGECRLSTQNMTHAKSPAFDIEGYNWKSGRYSTWTESTWSTINVRIFLKPSKTLEITTLTIGFVVLILSFCLVFIINNSSDILFGNESSSSASTTIHSEPAAC